MSLSDATKIIKDARITGTPVLIPLSVEENDVDVLIEPDDIEDADHIEITDAGSDEEPAIISPQSVAIPPPVRPDEELIEQARQEAEMIIAEAKDSAIEIRNRAAEDGRKDGMRLGMEQGRRDIEKKMADDMRLLQEQAKNILEQADREAKETIFQAENDIIELVLAISRKVMMSETEERRSAVLSLVRNALEKVRDQEKINIRVNPEDYEFLLQSRRELQRVVGVDKSIMVSVDPIVGRGGCSIDTAFGSVDAGIDTQLEMIRRAFSELKQ